MKMILIIPAQKATQNVERQAVLLDCFRDGYLLLESRDYKKPATFYLKPGDCFPWKQFISKMLANWQLGDFKNLPKAFKPLKRIPLEVIEGILKEPETAQLKILATLRNQGYFASLSIRK